MARPLEVRKSELDAKIAKIDRYIKRMKAWEKKLHTKRDALNKSTVTPAVAPTEPQPVPSQTPSLK